MPRRRAELITDDEPEIEEPAAPQPQPLSPTGEHLLSRLKAHVRDDPVFGQPIAHLLDADWQEIAGGIEAEDELRQVRVDYHEIVVTTKKWGSALRVALR